MMQHERKLPAKRDLLRAVAVYAAGGRKALVASGNAGAVKLLQELGGSA